jgi:hypothetical protein
MMGERRGRLRFVARRERCGGLCLGEGDWVCQRDDTTPHGHGNEIGIGIGLGIGSKQHGTHGQIGVK